MIDDNYDMDDIHIHDSDIVIENDKLKYFLFKFDREVSPGVYEPVYKAIRLIKIKRIPKKDLALSKHLDMQAGVITGYYQNQLNYLQIIANIIKPEPYGLIYAYGVQGVSSDSFQEAKESADIQMAALERGLTGTFRTLEYIDLTAAEGRWIYSHMSKLDNMRIIRGTPVPKKAGGRGTNQSLMGSSQNSQSEEQNEEFLLGMDNYEYLLVIQATTVTPRVLSKWQNSLLKEQTFWASIQKGTKSHNFGISMPVVFGTNMGTTSGWGNSRNESFGQNYGHTTGTSEGWNEGTSHSISNSQSNGNSFGLNSGVSSGESFGKGSSIGNNTSSSHGTNNSTSIGENNSFSEGTNSSTSHGTSENFGQSHSTSNSFSQSENWGSSQSTSQSTGTSYGTSSSTGTSTGYNQSASNSTSSSSGTSSGYGTGTSSGLNAGLGGILGLNSGDSTSTSAGMSTSNSASHSQSSGWSTGTSTSHGVNSGWSSSTGYSEGTSHGTGISNSTGSSDGVSYSNGISNSTSNGTSQSMSTGTSLTNSSGNSESYSTGNSLGSSTSYGQNIGASQGSSLGQSFSQSSGETYGTSSGHSTGISESYNEGNSISHGSGTSTSGSTSYATSGSMGLGPNISFGQSFAWEDRNVSRVIEVIEDVKNRVVYASNNVGMWYTDVYLITESEEASAAATALAMSSWHSPERMAYPLQVYKPSLPEKDYLKKHLSVFSPSTLKDGHPGQMEPYKYTSLLLSSEIAAYSHPPRANIGGIQAAVDDPPVLTIPADRQNGEIFLGYVCDVEKYDKNRGYKSRYKYTINSEELHHCYISGASRSGKTVAALRFVAEAFNNVRRGEKKKPLRIICMDPKQDWRTLSKIVPPEKFRFYSLADPLFHPIKMNLMKIPKNVYVERYADKLREVFVRTSGLSDRGYQLFYQAITDVYRAAGCLDEDAKLNQLDPVSNTYLATERSQNVTLEDVGNQLKFMQNAAKDNGSKEAIQRIIDRVQDFAEPGSVTHGIFCNRGDTGLSIEDLLGGDGVIVLESFGLPLKISSFVFGLLTSSIYQYAVANNGFVLPDDQYETILVIEEANQVLIGEKEDNLGGQNPFETILDQSAGLGLFIWPITQKIADMPSSILANCAIKMIGRQDRPDDIDLTTIQIGKDARINDRVFKNWLPDQPIGWFIIKSARNADFTKNAPCHVQIERLSISPPSNQELDQILAQAELSKFSKVLSEAHKEDN